MPAINDTNRTEVIDLYLHGLLQGQALEEFNRRLATDEDLKREVALQRSIMQQVAEVGRTEVRMYLKQLHYELVQHDGSNAGEINSTAPEFLSRQQHHSLFEKKHFVWKLAAAVTFLALLAFAGYFAMIDSGKVFAWQFQPYTLAALRSDVGDISDVVYFYRSNDYNKCVQRYAARQEKSVQETFLAGNAYLILSQPDKSIQCFDEVIRLNENLSVEEKRFSQDAEYFLGLAYLKNNQPHEAEKILKRIYNSPSHAYHSRIRKDLLLKIKLLKFKQEF